MRIKIWGTRGSIAIANPESVKAGGNTTCYEIMSQCLPQGIKLMIDAGTGFVPAGWRYLPEMGRGLKYVIFCTHWHYDHIMGLTLAPPTFIDQIPMDIYGPRDEGIGPKEMINHLFKRPFFPVDAKRVSHKMNLISLEDFDVHVIAIHPKGGFSILSLDVFHVQIGENDQLSINQNTYPLEECMIVRMAKTNHGNANCISYRFEEMPTGKTFVFCTDHEDVAAVSADLRSHISGADLIIMDAQYDDERYMTKTAGFGHGTPFGCVKQGVICNAKRIGITHHDPASNDQFLEGKILPEAHEALRKISTEDETLNIHELDEVILTKKDIFLCYDYEEIEI